MLNPDTSGQQQSGQATVEYALIIVLVAIVIILAVVAVSGGLQQTFQNVSGVFGTGVPEKTVELKSTASSVVSTSPDNTSPTDDHVETSSTTEAGSSNGSNGSGNTNRYFDQFDGKGNITWKNSSGKWAVSNQVFTNSDVNAQVIGAIPFANYEFTADVQTLESKGSNTGDVTRILFRVESESSFYAVMIKKDGMVELAKNTPGGWQGWLSVTVTKLNAFDNHNFRIKAFGDHLQIFIDNKKYVDFRDPNPILSGGIGFTGNNSIGRLDNVEVNHRAQD